MGLKGNKRAASSEVIKIAAAMLLAFAIFAMLASFALGPKAADTEISKIGEELANYTNKTAFKILNYANDSE